jgi:3-hydroxyisobutyrate dehydrogenase
MLKIGFIGLGHMGQPMAINLLKKGYSLTVFDLVADAVKKLQEHGANAAQVIHHTAKEVDVLITMLQTGEQVKQVCLGPEGLFTHLKKNAIYIDCSSIDISSSHQLHQEAEKKNIIMVDAPVSGGVSAAQAGSLTFMVGGAVESFEKAKPILEAMGKKIVHTGIAGTGQAAKICNNMILGISMIGVCEAFNLGEKLGLAAEKLFEVSSNASGQCWSLTSYAPVPEVVPSSPANRDFQPGFTAKMMLKDLLLSQNAAQTMGANTPLGAEATSLYSLFVDQGFGDLDFSGIIQFLKAKK